MKEFEDCRALLDILQVVACADIDMQRAISQADRYGIPKACTVEELLADPDIEIVVNLTIPNAHAEVALQAIAAGKAVYSEKPLAIQLTEGKAILRLSTSRMQNIIHRHAQECTAATKIGKTVRGVSAVPVMDRLTSSASSRN